MHISRTKIQWHRLIKIGLSVLVLTSVSYAINEKVTRSGKLFPWGTKIRSYYDQVIREKHPEGDWFLNLGATGIRARISKDQPKLMVVEYVFQDKASPAKGKVFQGDVIAGANGKAFKTPHQFGKGGRGWDGPLMELAAAIEASQADDGELDLIVFSKEKPGVSETVSLKMGRKEKFSETFPYNC